MRSKPIVNLERIVFSGFSSLSTQAMFTIVLVIDVVDAEHFGPSQGLHYPIPQALLTQSDLVELPSTRLGRFSIVSS